VTAVEEATDAVVILNVAEVAPAATVIDAGPIAAMGLELEIATTAPPDGAGADSVTLLLNVHVAPLTMVGESTRDETETPAAVVVVAVVRASVCTSVESDEVERLRATAPFWPPADRAQASSARLPSSS